MKKIISLLLVCIIASCNESDDNLNLEEINSPEGSSNAIAVFNHAYIENYEVDQVAYIALNATNAYVLVDPFEDDVAESIAEIKDNGNQLAAYISIGTG